MAELREHFFNLLSLEKRLDFRDSSDATFNTHSFDRLLLLFTTIVGFIYRIPKIDRKRRVDKRI